MTGFVRFANSEIEQSIPARFARMVERFPDRPAIGAGEASLSYEALHRRSNRIANALLELRGPGAEPVAVLMHQGARQITALLAVLKAGKFYVPLDPSHPDAHNRDIVAAAEAGFTITEAGFDRLAAHVTDTPPELPIAPEGYACIYYTSGSTGRPKGVLDCHRNVLHNILRYTNSLEISPEDRLTLLQAPVFSGAVSSMFAALLNGAAVVPYDVRSLGMGRPLSDWLRREQITIYHSVPAIFRSLVPDGSGFPSVRVIRLEGDAASSLDAALFNQRFSARCVLVNGLGATETGIVRQFFLRKGEPLTGGILPIGYATQDMAARIIDPAGAEAPPGEVGEVAIQSRYLALGYWKQPDLTAAAFRDAPNGERIYRTGDLGRMRPDGCIEYLGRKDQRPKVRGHRVEPAEVESALLGIEGVREAVAVIREARGGGEVVAYLAPLQGTPDPSTLRTQLATRVPPHLVPSRFVYLDRLPLNENNKVDRLALAARPLPEEGRTAPEPPSDPVEAQLVEIWERILDRRPIGVSDDFFALGGTSLLAAELVFAVEQLGHRELPPSTLLDAPTIRAMASLLRRGGDGRATALVSLQPLGSRPPFFMIPAHSGNILQFFELARTVGPDQPFYVLQPLLDGDGGGLAPSIEVMAERYLTEVRRVQPAGPYFFGGQCYGGVVALEMAHQLRAAGQEVGLLWFIFASPEDFPGLVTERVRRRFLRYARLDRFLEIPQVARARYHLRELASRSAGQQVRYFRDLMGRVAQRAADPAGTPVRRHPGPLPHEVIARHNREVQRHHVPRAWPGRVSLILRAEDTTRYSDDPATDWRGISELGLDVRFLPYVDGAVFAPPRVQELATILVEAIRHSTPATP